MHDPASLLQKVQERIKEKDQVIEEQMEQIVDLEDKLSTQRLDIEALQAELKELRRIKEEYETMKRQLDQLDSILE